MASGGRPAGPTGETRERVLAAAFHLLVTEGPAELTPVRLHRETGIARTTIYRHWPTAREIVDDILTQAVARHELDELTGDFSHDLPIAVATLTFRFDHRPVHAFYRATLAVEDAEESPTVSQRYIGGLISPVRDVVAAAVDRGDLDADVDALTSRLCGPLLLDHVLLGRPVDHADVDARVERILGELLG